MVCHISLSLGDIILLLLVNEVRERERERERESRLKAFSKVLSCVYHKLTRGEDTGLVVEPIKRTSE